LAFCFERQMNVLKRGAVCLLGGATSRRPVTRQRHRCVRPRRLGFHRDLGALAGLRATWTSPFGCSAPAPAPDTFLRTWLLVRRTLPPSQVWRLAPHRFGSAICSRPLQGTVVPACSCCRPLSRRPPPGFHLRLGSDCPASSAIAGFSLKIESA
jgi:hypothetical protein